MGIGNTYGSGSTTTSSSDGSSALSSTEEAQLSAAYDAAHTHDNMATLDDVEEALTTALKTYYDNSAQLDESSQLMSSQIPDSLLAGLEWQGTIDVTTGSVDSAASDNNGYFYKNTVAGDSSITGSSVTWAQGDWLISNGTAWERVPTTFNSATTEAEGVVQLAGDIGGTSSGVTVTGIQGIEVSDTTPSDGQLLTYDDTSGTYIPLDNNVVRNDILNITEAELEPGQYDAPTTDEISDYCQLNEKSWLVVAYTYSDCIFTYFVDASYNAVLLRKVVSGSDESETTETVSGTFGEYVDEFITDQGDNVCSMCVYDGVLYTGANSSNEVYCYDTTTGEQLDYWVPSTTGDGSLQGMVYGNGYLHLLWGGTSTLYKYTTSGSYVGSISLSSSPSSVNWKSLTWDGTYFYAWNLSDYNTYRITTAGYCTDIDFNPGTVAGVTSSYNGNLDWYDNTWYWAVTGAYVCTRYDSSMTYTTGDYFDVSDRTNIQSVAIDENYIYISGDGPGSVSRYYRGESLT